MFTDLTDRQRNQHVEVCRYFFRANVMKKHLDALVAEHGGIHEAVTNEWDEFWAYYWYWLSGLFVVCEGIIRIRFGDDDFITFAKESKSRLHPIRQATFHYKSDLSEMMKHFDTEEIASVKPWEIHDRITDVVAAFLMSLPAEYLEAMDDHALTE